jgi:hypothetical protein
MKKMAASLLLALSASAFSSEQPLLLDASCKVLCQVNIKEIQTSQTQSFKSEYENLYIDHVSLTRKQLDKKNEKSELNKLCQENFNEKSLGIANDCLTFKH